MQNNKPVYCNIFNPVTKKSAEEDCDLWDLVKIDLIAENSYGVFVKPVGIKGSEKLFSNLNDAVAYLQSLGYALNLADCND